MRAMRCTVLAMGFVGALVGCAGQVETHTDSGAREDERTSSTKALLHTNAAAAHLERARQAVGEGHFDDGLAEYQATYVDSDAKPEHKEAALFGMGQVYSNVLNPKRDVEKALIAYRRLLAEFPDTKLRADVEHAVAGLEAEPK